MQNFENTFEIDEYCAWSKDWVSGVPIRGKIVGYCLQSIKSKE